MGFYPKKRGQFTIFIILGLVILFAFSFAIFARARVMSTQLTAQADRQIKEYIDKNSIDQYVTSCLDAVSEQTVIDAGLQGGTYNFTGKIPGQDYVSYQDKYYNTTVNVSIVIDSNYNCPDGRDPSQYIVTQNPPNYPYTCGNVYLNQLDSLYQRFGNGVCFNNCTLNSFKGRSGFFGINSLPTLCDYYGPNSINYAYNNTRSISCDYYVIDSNLSMQRQMESRIESEMSKCVNFTDVLSRSSSNITIVGNASANIIFGDGGFRVVLEYPFTVMMYNKQPVTRMIDFQVDKGIAFKELYEYAYELANSDVKDIFFDVVAGSKTVLSRSIRRPGKNTYTSNYVVTMSPGGIGNNFTDILTVIDNDHSIRGRPLLINMAVRNRRPALDYIHDGNSQYFDIQGIENETLLLKPQGYDPDYPDKNSLIYSYGYWKEDYDQYFDFSNPKCSGTSPTTMAYIIANCTKINITGGSPHNWTKSGAYVTSKQNATYIPRKADVGFHTVLISIADRSGLEDYQEVRIMVFDLPEAKIKGSNTYTDVPDNYASYEDLYILNGSESKVGMAAGLNATLSTFTWNDPQEPFKKIINIVDEASKSLRIPSGINVSITPSMINIKSLAFIYKPATSTIHNVSLIINTSMGVQSNPTYFSVNVTQCLPHRSNTNPEYPYNSQPYDMSDALQANHTCCYANYTYANNNVECYRSDTYGSVLSFTDYTSRQPSPPNMATYSFSYTNLPPSPGRMDNDILEQTFVRKCSGDSGNTCTGSVSEIKKDAEYCDDTNFGTVATERCSGPPAIYSTPNSSTTSKPSCVNYTTGQTFEKTILGSGSGYCTGNTKMQSDSNIFGTGSYSCYGSCNSGSCKPSSCTCDVAYNSDAKCAGLAPGSHDALHCGDHYGTTSNQYFMFECDNCAINTAVKRCLYQPAIGCYYGSNTGKCNGKQPGDSINECVPGIGNTNVPDKCDSTCGLIDDGTTCKLGNGCNADTSCDNVQIGNAATGSNNKWCDNTCQPQECPNNKAFKRGSCFVNACTPKIGLLTGISDDCKTGAVCCGTGKAKEGECVSDPSQCDISY